MVMSKHVAPHRWADLLAGTVDDEERTTLERHAAECARCARARQRVSRASDTFPAIRTQSAPELGWDGVRARVHWSVSTAKHERVRMAVLPTLAATLRKHVALAGTGVALAAAATVGTVMFVHHRSEPIALVPVTPKHVAPPAAVTALVSRVAGDVMIDGVRPARAFDVTLGQGSVLATGDGRLDVQFGEASAFALGARSTLELRMFDADTIELRVEGSVDLVVAPRAKTQRFRVLAGDETIEVRGTRFSVTHDASGTHVACQHGLVAVRDVAGEVAVGAAREAFVPAGHTLANTQAVPLSAEALDRLVKTTPWTTPSWTPDLAAHSAPLAITTAASRPPARARDVRVDGIELGQAPFAMRVMPGRHTIEAADAKGRFRRAGWVDVAAGAASQFEALPIVEDEPSIPTNSIAVRKKQLAAGIDRERLRACTRRLAKSGLDDTYVQLEIAVDDAGAVNVLNIVDTDLPSATASCVHDVLADVHFAAGPAATWHEKLRL
jgi:hypothetical protein